ncbi:aspartate/glutamate racemase family protein [Roseomonas sp. HJA6]|uniref:Aspartate/glutamate racemase family protein n=1 Tax=Roseomonas alba TaxID=2846776 RepID=A0ABS7AE43_9PROT|nr:aspartate/glutamate racemase family protein [Neoroseomonas alba]MBW6400572.1 aspartate/glutamate racemase family protein [Neoroseomonas alba]
MRLLLLNGNTDPAITALIATRAAEALPRLGLPPAELVPVTAPFGARYISTRAAVAIAGHAVLAALADHIGRDNPAGCDAAIIACFGEPGIEAARELLPIPVVGMAEASIAAALAIAPRVALLTGGALWVPMLEEFVLIRGFGPDQVMVRGIAPTGDMIARDPDGAAALLAEAAQAAAAEGAGAVVLGGAGLAGIAPRVAPLVSVPVLDSLDCALAAALGGGAARERVAQAPMVGVSDDLRRWFA